MRAFRQDDRDLGRLDLDTDEVWIHARAADADGGYEYGIDGRRWREQAEDGALDRGAGCSVQRDGVGDNAPGAWSFDRDVPAHDGGELVWLKTDARATRVGLKIRRRVWRSGPNEDSLVLYVDDEGAEQLGRAVSYGWADPGARRLGINLRWMQASCSQQP